MRNIKNEYPETESEFVVVRGWEWGMMANGGRVYFWGGGMFWNEGMVAQLNRLKPT